MPNEAPNESNTAVPTPVDGGNVDTTQAAADKTATTPQPEGGNQPDIDKIVKARLDRERKKWESEREEVEKRARMDEAERLKADLADRDKRIAEAEAKATAAERRASLTGKVADPAAALKLLDEEKHLTADGTVNVDALLKSYPFLAPTQATGAPAGSTGAPTAGAARALTIEDFRGKSQEWIIANRSRLKRTP